MKDVDYVNWTSEIFGTPIPVPGVLFAASFPPESKWGAKVNNALIQVELEYVDELLKDLLNHNVNGAIAEFGVFEGWWVNQLFEATERIGLHVPVLGFDSFKGLSAPQPELDEDCWKEGMFCAAQDLVEQNIHLAERPRIRLIPGFFAESLLTDEAHALGEIAYARVDCDIRTGYHMDLCSYSTIGPTGLI
jgi:Macrocin-O-methyltransferase (TylF)